MDGYGNITEDLVRLRLSITTHARVANTNYKAFKTAIHTGNHLICWGTGVEGWGTAE